MEGKTFGPDGIKEYKSEVQDQGVVAEGASAFLLEMLENVNTDIAQILEESKKQDSNKDDLITRFNEAKERKSKIEELLGQAKSISGKAKDQLEAINEVIKELESKLN